MWEFIDKIVYINLDHREDRREIMKKFFAEGQIPEDKIMRFPAISSNKGYIGCLKSHTAVLEIAKNNKWKNVLILEDDLQWYNLDTQYKVLEDLVTTKQWDVIQLVGWYVKYDFPRIYETMNSGAYLVNEHYYDRLIANRRQSIKRITGFEVLYKPFIQFTCDVYWNKLAAIDNWYGLYPCICRQVDIYSDNSKITYKQSEVNGIYPGREEQNKIFVPIQNAQ